MTRSFRTSRPIPWSSKALAWTNESRVDLAQVQPGLTPAPSVSIGEEPEITLRDPGGEAALLPVDAAKLRAAATRLRPDSAITRALTRLLEGGWTYHDQEELTLRFEPRSRGRGKKPPRSYSTTHDSCTCPGAIIRGGCYHPTAWQIVSEALLPTTSMACAVPSALFVPLCLLALSSGIEHLILSADSERRSLTLGAPNIASGTLTVETTTPVLLMIEQQVRATDLGRIVDALAGALPAEGEQIMLEVRVGSLLVIAGAEDAPVLVDGLDALPMDSLTS